MQDVLYLYHWHLQFQLGWVISSEKGSLRPALPFQCLAWKCISYCSSLETNQFGSGYFHNGRQEVLNAAICADFSSSL